MKPNLNKNYIKTNIHMDNHINQITQIYENKTHIMMDKWLLLSWFFSSLFVIILTS